MADSNASNNPTQNRIVVHHLNNSRSQRILWLLEELEVPYEIKKYQRTPELLAPEELKEVHPLGKSPVITDGDRTIAESGAIVEYLITKYGGDKFKPTDSGFVDNLYFTHYSEGTLMPLLVNKLIFTIIPQRAPFFIRPIANVLLSAIEEHLAKSSTGWLANGPNPTCADFMMIFPLEAVQKRVPGSGKSTVIDDYVKRVHERSAYQRALEKGGKFDIL